MNFGKNYGLVESIDRGLTFLQGNQLESGEFKSYRSRHPDMLEGCEFDSSPFPTALIAYNLSFVASHRAEPLRQKAAAFLLSEIEPLGLWRYWSSDNALHKYIPPDADDTACVSLVLRQMQKDFADNRRVLLANRNKTGLVYTWIIPRIASFFSNAHWRAVWRQLLNPLVLWYFFKINESEPGDVDAVVNANVLAYLGKCTETQPIIDYLTEIILEDRSAQCDKWHLSPLNLYYSVSRTYKLKVLDCENVKAHVLEDILSRASPDGRIGETVLDTALAACSLLNFSHSSRLLSNAIDFLLREQSDDGSWKKSALYFGGPKRYFGWGSEELTTGFCLEAITRFTSGNTRDGNTAECITSTVAQKNSDGSLLSSPRSYASSTRDGSPSVH